MTFVEVSSALSDVSVGIAAAVTAFVAFQGLKSWQRELKGKAEFEAARNLVRSTYKLRDELRNCRSPFVSAGEFPESYRGALGKHSTEEELEAWAHVYKARWAPVAQSVQEFDAQVLEAESIWGSDIRARSDALRKCAQSLYAAIQAFLSDKASGGEDFKSNREFGVEIRKELNDSGGNQENKLSKEIATAVTEIDAFVRPHLRRS